MFELFGVVGTCVVFTAIGFWLRDFLSPYLRKPKRTMVLENNLLIKRSYDYNTPYLALFNDKNCIDFVPITDESEITIFSDSESDSFILEVYDQCS